MPFGGQQSARNIARAVAGGKTSCEAATQACLDRIAARDETVRAWTFVDPEAALAQARNLDTVPATERGALHGVPVGIKDVFLTKDMPTGYNSPIYDGYRSRQDAATVALLRQAGAVILGKTDTTEFATMHPGKARNPRDPARTPGGSSSGSAAAVGDGMVPLALGTQTAGSTIRPASYNGIVGYKPSYGRIPRAGVVLLSETLDTIGFFGTTVEDVALCADICGGRAPGRFGRMIGGLETVRVGFCRSHEWDRAEPAMQEAVEKAARHFSATDAILPLEFQALADAHWDVLAYETTRSLAAERIGHPDAITDTLWEIFDLGLSLSEDDYEAAIELGDTCRLALDDLFRDWGVDVLITPAAPGEAPHGLEKTGDPILNRVWTFLHVPCVSLPLFEGPEGLPMGLQVIGPRGKDAQTLAVADWLWKHWDG